MEAGRLKKKKAVTGVVIGLVVAQLAAVIAQIASKETDHGGADSPLPWVIIALVGVLVAIAVLVVVRKKRSAGASVLTSSSPEASPVGVFVGVGLLTAGVFAGMVVFMALGGPPPGISTPFYLAVAAVAALLVVLIFAGVMRVFVTGTKLSALALPDSPPPVEVSTDPVFGRRSGQLGGTSLLNRRVLGVRVPVYGKGFEKRGGGNIWLANEAIAFTPALSRTPAVIPYALIHAINRREVDGKPWLQVVWGRPELPMETTIQISGKRQETDLWAQEISRRTTAWKAKTKASR
jgi:hypothetical protein